MDQVFKERIGELCGQAENAANLLREANAEQLDDCDHGTIACEVCDRIASLEAAIAQVKFTYEKQ